ncbi:MAG: DNA-directed RNA polymerase subunit omega [Acidobacteria bacterium]|nr:DNA-directed RNA polymerase subunit omega [Acidobacteriota bacterium]MYD70046.1 DNA-directed RNA polymerase subunit omega [Acidobacteriota bacterium]MYJ05546.1 DNA-directed RNA polymerase subunit omega [Acidobacteriota bacterium]
MAKEAVSVDEAAKLPEDEAVALEQPAADDTAASDAAAAGTGAAEDNPELAAEAEPGETAPIESRFLYVDVAAQRAKQLRRGAVPRLADVPAPDLDNPHSAGQRLKLERVAMREVDAGKIVYEVPTDDDTAKAD